MDGPNLLEETVIQGPRERFFQPGQWFPNSEPGQLDKLFLESCVLKQPVLDGGEVSS